MCNYCGGIGGHAIGCPDARIEAVGVCPHCKRPITEGERVIEINGQIYCECLTEETAEDLLEIIGGKFTRAEANYD